MDRPIIHQLRQVPKQPVVRRLQDHLVQGSVGFQVRIESRLLRIAARLNQRPIYYSTDLLRAQ